MTLLMIVVATLAAGVGSVWIAAGLMRFGLRDDDGTRGFGAQHLLSLAAGALLATSFVHLLPEAFEGGTSVRALFATFLVGLVVFFLMDKAELWHHGNEHHHDHAHAHPHGAHAPHGPAAGGWSVLTGDGLHCFGDGILIASAFMADVRLGWVVAMSVLAHEVPHHIGDLVVLRAGSSDRRAAVLKVSLAGSVTVLGGLAGWWLVDQLREWLPYFLVVACSSFVYVALADLIPQLQRRLSTRQTLAQIMWLVAGIGMVLLVSQLAHTD